MEIFFPALIGKLVSRFGIRPGPVNETPLGLADLTPVTSMDELAKVPIAHQDTDSVSANGFKDIRQVPEGERWTIQCFHQHQEGASDYDWETVLIRAVTPGSLTTYQTIFREAAATHTNLFDLHWTLYPGDRIGVNITNYVATGNLVTTIMAEAIDCAS